MGTRRGDEHPGTTPRSGLERLLQGNRRFTDETSSTRTRLTLTRETRELLAAKQAPFAAIVSCSDSRVPAELIFDQGLGDLFVVRNAGAAVAHAALASIEFACAELGTKVVLVLAHERCGAFRAAAKAGPAPSESLAELVKLLAPSLEAAGPGDLEERCERAALLHARSVAETIASSPVVAPLVERGQVLVVTGLFRLAAGTVHLIETPAARAISAGSPS